MTLSAIAAPFKLIGLSPEAAVCAASIPLFITLAFAARFDGALWWQHLGAM